MSGKKRTPIQYKNLARLALDDLMRHEDIKQALRAAKNKSRKRYEAIVETLADSLRDNIEGSLKSAEDLPVINLDEPDDDEDEKSTDEDEESDDTDKDVYHLDDEEEEEEEPHDYDPYANGDDNS